MNLTPPPTFLLDEFNPTSSQPLQVQLNVGRVASSFKIRKTLQYIIITVHYRIARFRVRSANHYTIIPRGENEVGKKYHMEGEGKIVRPKANGLFQYLNPGPKIGLLS
jgi:hypothetical protein